MNIITRREIRLITQMSTNVIHQNNAMKERKIAQSL